MTEQEARWRALVERFAQAADAPPGVIDLVQAINGPRDQSIGCEACRAELPAYIEAEMGGLPINQKYPQVRQHLNGCVECEAEYVTILELALAEEAALVAIPVKVPTPDLSFLPPLKLPDYVRVLTEDIVAAMSPGLIEELRAIADLFFEHVTKLGRQFKFGPAAAPALGFGAGETPESLKLLAATYAATVALTANRSASELEAQARTGQLAALLRAEAQRAARQMRLSSSQTKRFVETYVELVGREVDTLQRLAR